MTPPSHLICPSEQLTVFRATHISRKMTVWLTGQFTDKPTRGQSSRGLVNSQTSQLADSDFF